VSREKLLQQIKAKAKQDQQNRRDARFLETMGLLVAKGFLRTNFEVPLLPKKRIRVEDAIWAGKNVEPRILEVLPAAILRLARHFELQPEGFADLMVVVGQLRRRERNGDAFFDIPYEKLRQWADFPLRDRRIKTIGTKKVAKTFRLEPAVLDRLKAMAKEQGITETEVVEGLVKSRL
jgi:hypothetical protein